MRKWWIFKNRKTGATENFYGDSTAADVHVKYNPDLYCIEVRDL